MSNKAGAAHSGALAINILNSTLETIAGLMVAHDQDLLYEHSKVVGQAIADLNTAISKDMIPNDYLNNKGLSDILNVILQGENTTDNKEIMDLGIQILKDISKKYDDEKIKW